ncbi:alcohol dehydrogenase catalytic domain-containing protein [Alcaligenaceae bacterium]|nr:alcohol dehydrogenase catalytic domain-containing protein [Alcaligenaceae bacterium]
MRCYCINHYNEPLVEMKMALPKPKAEEVLIKVQAAGVCHSDLHIWEGGYDLGGGEFLSLKARGATLPHTLGHETAGVVVSMGPNATGVEVGESYLVYPWIGCGNCSTCISGNENLCTSGRPLGVLEPGGYAEYMLVPKPKYLLALNGLDPAIAAPFACSGLTTYSALKKLGNDIATHFTVIVGAGGLGLMCVSILRAMGGKGAIVVDIDKKKRDAALAAGAHAAIDGNADNVAELLIQAAEGAPRSVIDFVGSPETTKLGFNILVKGGKLVVVGLYGGSVSLPIALIPVRGVSIIGNLVGNLEELTELMELVHSGKVPFIPITKQALSEANDVLTRLKEGRVIGRTILIPE